MTVEKMQNLPKVTVWCGMNTTSIIGPYLLRDTMNSERYLQMLRDYICPTVSGWENIDDSNSMQAGTPSHFANAMLAWLGEEFPGRWLGRRGSHEWVARSQELTACDFFLWGRAKDEVYRTNPKNWKHGFATLSPMSHTTSSRRLWIPSPAV
jgi:hypothetical protein